MLPGLTQCRLCQWAHCCTHGLSCGCLASGVRLRGVPTWRHLFCTPQGSGPLHLRSLAQTLHSCVVAHSPASWRRSGRCLRQQSFLSQDQGRRVRRGIQRSLKSLSYWMQPISQGRIYSSHRMLQASPATQINIRGQFATLSHDPASLNLSCQTEQAEPQGVR